MVVAMWMQLSLRPQLEQACMSLPETHERGRRVGKGKKGYHNGWGIHKVVEEEGEVGGGK